MKIWLSQEGGGNDYIAYTKVKENILKKYGILLMRSKILIKEVHVFGNLL
jgi:hypothetical protein